MTTASREFVRLAEFTIGGRAMRFRWSPVQTVIGLGARGEAEGFEAI